MRRRSRRAEQDNGRNHVIGSEEERELFLERYDKYPRSVLSESPAVLGVRSPQLLISTLQQAIRRLVRADGGAWRGFIVKVEEGDGMTWSAAAADRVVGESSPLPRRRLTAEPRVDGFPQIVELLPKQRLIALAQEKEVVPPLRALRRSSVVIAAIVMLVLGAAIAALQGWTSTLAGFSAFIPLGGAALVALGLGKGWTSARLDRSAREADENRLIDQMKTAAEERPQAWHALVEALSQELARTKKDRAVIVDNFDRLDRITHDTLCHYLTHRSSPSQAHELWVVFETMGVATASKAFSLVPRRRGRSRLVRLEVLQQISLDRAARIRLAAEIGRPERARFHLVKWIVCPESKVIDAYWRLYDGVNADQRHDARAYGPLEISYLMAVQQGTGDWGFRPQELVSDLSSGVSSAHRKVLRLLLPGAKFTRSEVDDAVGRLSRGMDLVLDSERAATGEIALAMEAAQMLVERREQYGLPAEDVVHLYWALYWYAKLQGAPDVDIYLLRKLARHLVRAVAPGALEADVGEGVRERFRDALVWTAQALLSASLPDDVRMLLIRAEQEAAPGEDPTRLRSVCWQAYAVLGDESMLAIILRLHPGSKGAPAAATDPESLFIDSLRFTDPVPIERSELSERLLSLDPDVLAYAQIRGIWLALILDPRITGAWSHFSSVAEDSASQVLTLTYGALRSLADHNRLRPAVAALTASLGTWAYALCVIRGEHSVAEANTLFENVRLHAAQLHHDLDERRRLGESEDFVLRAFGNELETVAGAAALLVSVTSRAAEASDEDRARLEDHISAALGTTTHRADVQLDEMERQMTLQALTWTTLGSSSERPLGFDQLAAFTTLRGVHLSILLAGGSWSVNDARSALTGQLNEPGVVGLMADAIVMWASSSEEIAAHLWARACGRSAGLGRGLAREVCIAALSTSHAFHSIDRPLLAERLLGGDENAPSGSDLAARLAEFEDEIRPEAALWLLNVAGDRRVAPTSAEALVELTRELRSHTADEAVREEIQQMIELFELERDVREGRPVPAAEMLARWEPRRESSHYGWFLHLLSQQPKVDTEVVEAAASYLRSHPDAPRFSGPVLLACDLARLASRDDSTASSGCREVALDYLDRIHPLWEFALPIEENVNISRLLFHWSIGDRTRNLASLERWEAARQERDGFEKLPVLVEGGRFFLVFWHYFETLSFYGLSVEPETSLGDMTSRDSEERALVEWEANGETVPEAMVRGRSGTCLSADFLRYGHALFGKATEDPDLEEARGMFNEAALEVLPALLDQLTSLRSLPERVRTLLDEHRAQLLRPAVAA
jgi:hypothetical protein